MASGEGRGTSPGEVHDIALKAAETDATKRALATFGKPFGLALYRNGKSASRQPGARAFAAMSAEPRALWLPSGRHDPYPEALTLLWPAAIPSTDQQLRNNRADQRSHDRQRPPLVPADPICPGGRSTKAYS